MDKKQFEWKNIAILGFWLEWKSTLNFLLQNNFSFNKLTVLDMKDQPWLESTGVWVETWEHYLDHLSQYDVIFKSAGVPYSEELLPFKDKILTQIQFFFNNYKGKVIAVTASKGKSTMTSLIYTILKDAWFSTKLVWNIWNPVLDEINFKEEYDYVVCELSSYMLECLEKKNYISVLWNIFPEHMDWHGWFDRYVQAKLNILKGSEYNFVLAKTVQEYGLSDKYNNIETPFAPVPMSDEGAYFLDMPNLQFSVNKDSSNLDMANEFMRFLITPRELNEMAQNKGLISPTKDLSFNSMYAALGAVPESRILSPEVFGLSDDAVIQLRLAGYLVGTGEITIDEAVAGYGTFTKWPRCTGQGRIRWGCREKQPCYWRHRNTWEKRPD